MDPGRKFQAVLLALIVLAVIVLFWMWYMSPERWDRHPPPRISPVLVK
jgi:hypothetical protein